MFRIEGSNGKYDGDYSTKEAAIKAIEIWKKSYPCIEFKVLEIDDDASRLDFWPHCKSRDMIL